MMDQYNALDKPQPPQHQTCKKASEHTKIPHLKKQTLTITEVNKPGKKKKQKTNEQNKTKWGIILVQQK
jgi:hypothetical protein